MKHDLSRCWKTDDPLYIKYHDREWGVPVHDDQTLFEFLTLEGFQAGLTWELILRRREALRKAFDNFNVSKIAKYTDEDVKRLMNNPNVIRNRAKISATINNALRFKEVRKESGSFDAFIWKFVEGKTINNAFTDFSNMPAETELSKAISKELKMRGFKFVGPTICYAFMQAVGLVNDHLVHCFRYSEIKNATSRKAKGSAI
jgi:DNA-3-methyladenine glycosylase I